MKIAIVGTGISGLVCAHLLHGEHRLTLFEAGEHVGGHTLTSRVRDSGEEHWVDAGFIVYNEVNYPNFVRLLDRLGVDTQPSDMSFSVRDDRAGLEYCGTSLNTLFAQRRNLLRPSFLRMLADIRRFNRDGKALLSGNGNGWRPTLRQFLDRGGYRRQLVEQYLVPMAASIWSTRPEQLFDFPAVFILRFLDNHNLLNARGHYRWRTIRGGSQRYVEALIRPFRDRIQLRTPVAALTRQGAGVELVTAAGERQRFDEVIVATHSDQALKLLADPSPAEREVLGAIPYQPNRATLHTDESVLPRNERARASWNFHRPPNGDGRLNLTYDMGRLQSLEARSRFCVSLNMDRQIAAGSVLRQFQFAHPLFTPPAVAAQARHEEISGADRIHYCGAYWGNGFHEDGVVSALSVTRGFGREL